MCILASECCEARKVDLACQPLLCGEGQMSDTDTTLLDCYGDIDNVFACMSGKQTSNDVFRISKSKFELDNSSKYLKNVA